MSDKNKKDPIEQLFQEKAEKYNISYHEEDWLKLEKRLDNLDQQYKNQKKRWAVAAAVVLIFSLLAYSNYQNYLKINELNEKLNNQQITNVPSDNTPSSDPGEITDNQGSESENESIAATDAENQNNNETSPGSTSEEDQQQADAERGATVADPTVGDRGSNNYLAANSFARSSLRSEPACPECNLAESQNMLQPTVADLVKSGNDKPIRKPDRAPIAAMHPPVDSENQLMQRNPSRITIGLSIAPDMSTVGSISNFQNPGYKLGISVEYNLTENLGVSVGAMHSTVNYVADGGEYNPGIYWKDGIRPDEAIARCVLIDIPVSLKYNFAHFDHSRLYGTAGVSTYIMLNEDYQFEYQNYDNDLIQNWSDRTGTSHWMSNAGISIGYELDVNPNFSIRAEPFIKVPIREVGWGNVKLYSLGSFLSINYKLQTSK